MDRHVPIDRQAAFSGTKEVAGVLASAGARHVVLSTSGDWLRNLVRFLQLEKVRR